MTKRLLPVAVLAALSLPAAAGGAGPLPETTIVAGPSSNVNTTSATFTFTSSDARARFACALDSGSFSNCVSPYSLSAGEGPHHFYVVAVDGNTTDPTPAVRAWTVDTHAPAALKAHMSVRYGRLTLSWGRLQAIGASSIALYRTTNEKQAATREIYRGSATDYVDAKFRNGSYHRYRAIATDAAGNVSPPFDLVVKPDALLISPTAGKLLRAPLHLRWRPAPAATYYNAQLFRGDKKVLSAWPRTASLTVGKGWTYQGHRHRLTAGHYTWYVWPGFGRLALGHYGQLLGQSSFSVRS